MGIRTGNHFSDVADEEIGSITHVAILNMGNHRHALELGNVGLKSGGLLRVCLV